MDGSLVAGKQLPGMYIFPRDPPVVAREQELAAFATEERDSGRKDGEFGLRECRLRFVVHFIIFFKATINCNL